jgi:hypothetical protein
MTDHDELPRVTQRLFGSYSNSERLAAESADFVIGRVLEEGVSDDLRWLFCRFPEAQIVDWLEHTAVASPEDLGLMKLGAVISRGTRRDFVDLYLLCQRIPLSELLTRSQDKFGHVNDFVLQAIKGLADLSLTQGEPMPELSQPIDWNLVQKWLKDEIRSLARDRIGQG